MPFWWPEYRALLTPSGAAVWSRPSPRHSWHGQHGTGNPVEVLASLLGKGVVRGKLSLLVGAGLAVPVVLPWVEGMSRREEWLSYAAMCLAQEYSQPASDWRMVWQPGPYAKPSLAAGLLLSFEQELQAYIARTNIRLESLQPMLPVALNQYARVIQEDALVIVMEQYFVQLLEIRGGIYRQSCVLPKPPPEQWEGMINMFCATPEMTHQLVVADPGLRQLPAGSLGWIDPSWAGMSGRSKR